jgi:molybdate transport system substrate-binding protein
VLIIAATAPLCFFAQQAWSGDVPVYAAASLTDALNEVARAYQKHHPTVTIKPVYAASSTLAKQIENGAPAEVFISADQDWADYLDQRGLFAEGSRKDLLRNQLVLIAPKGKEIPITLERDFNLPGAFTGKLCTGEPGYVPVGKYAQQALAYYGWWEALKPRLVGTDDVRTAAAFVARGECPLGIVYATDAKIAGNLSVVASFPSESHKPIIYPGALLKKSSPDAKGFWAYLQSDEALSVFARYGFSPSKP